VSSSAIRIDGLAEFAKGLRKIDGELPKMLRLAMNEAADLVVAGARPGVPKRSGRAARSIRAASTRTAVRVSEGGPRAPYMPWLDYGGRVGRKHATIRPFIKNGRFVYPAYFKLRDSGKIQEILERSITDVAHAAGVVID
jgi:hypothetical protein